MGKNDSTIEQEFDRISNLITAANNTFEYLSCSPTLFIKGAYDKKTYATLLNEFRSTKNFMLSFYKDLWGLEKNIDKLYTFEDMKKPYIYRVDKMKTDFEDLKDKLDTFILQEYMQEKTSSLPNAYSGDLYERVGFMVKGIPGELFDCVDHQSIYVNEIDPELNEGFSYEIYILINKSEEDKISAIQKMYAYFNSVKKLMLQDYDYCNHIYLDYESKLNEQVARIPEDRRYKLDLKGKTQYKWQIEALKAWENNGYRGIFKVATGCGKTLFALSCINRIFEMGININIKIIVPSIAIVDQWYAVLQKGLNVNPKNIGRVYRHRYDIDRQFTIYTAKSAIKHFTEDIEFECSIDEDELSENDRVYQFIIADECHHYGSKEYAEILKCLAQIKPSKKYGWSYFCVGLSATPERPIKEETELLEKYLGKIIYNYDLIRAISENIVTKPVIKNLTCNFTDDEKNRFEKVRGILENKKYDLKELLNKNHYNVDYRYIINYAYEYIKRYRRELDVVVQKRNQFEHTYSHDQWQKEFSDWLEESANNKMKIAYLSKQITNAFQNKMDISYYVKSRIRMFDSLFDSLIDNIKQHKIIIFTEKIEFADALYKRLIAKLGSENVSLYHSKNENQKQYINSEKPLDNEKQLHDFKVGKKRIIVCVNALDEGVDISDADMAIVFQGTGGEREQIQRLGRIIRKAEGGNQKTNSILYNLFCLPAGERIYLAGYIERTIMDYKRGKFGELQDVYKKGLKLLGYDMDLDLYMIKNYQYLRLGDLDHIKQF